MIIGSVLGGSGAIGWGGGGGGGCDPLNGCMGISFSIVFGLS